MSGESPHDPNPTDSRIFSYGPSSVAAAAAVAEEDEDVDGAASGPIVADTFFDDDQAIDANETMKFQAGDKAHYGTLTLDEPVIAIGVGSSSSEDVKARLARSREIQRTMEQFGEFKMGNDGADEDDDDEDELADKVDDLAHDPNDLFRSNAIIQIDDEDDFTPRGHVGHGVHHSLNDEFSRNPLAASRANAGSFGGSDDDDEFAGNAIGEQGIFTDREPPSPAPQPRSTPEGSPVRMVVQADEYEPDASMSTQSRPAGLSRVFSYEDGGFVDDVQPGSADVKPLGFDNRLNSEGSASAPPISVVIDVATSSNQAGDTQGGETSSTTTGDDNDDSPPHLAIQLPLSPDGIALRVLSPSAVSAAGSVGQRDLLSPSGASSPPPRGSVSHIVSPSGRRVSISSLSPSIVHNRRSRASILASPRSPPPQRGGTTPSQQQQQHEILTSRVADRKVIESILSIDNVPGPISFPYSFLEKVGKDAYDLCLKFPNLPEDRRVSEFVEPSLGISTRLENEQSKHVELSDVIWDTNEIPTRFTRPQRKREFHPSTQVKGLANLMLEAKQSTSRHENVQCLILFNESSPIKSQVGEMIQQFGFLETIQFQQTKLKKFETPLVLPHLLNLDARSCKIKDISLISQICLNSPHLYSLTISDNPICDKFYDPSSRKPILPPYDHEIWKVLLLRLPSLEYFNLIPITNEQRYRAWSHTRSKKLHTIVGKTLWNFAVNLSTPISSLIAQGGEWKKDVVVELNLSKQSLLTFSLMPFRSSLQQLNLSSNHLTTLLGTGLHLCKNLKSLNLSNNNLSSEDELYVFAYLPLLRQLWLIGNNFNEGYSSHVIYATRHLKGLNRTPGLQELDDLQISFEQRITAFERHAPNGKVQASKERWRLMLIKYFGHQQLVQVPQLFVKLGLSKKFELSYADVTAMTGLISLDLSHCKLKTIEGLENLTQLRFLDVRFNPELKHPFILAQIQQLSKTIEWVSISHTEEEMLDFNGLRFKFLCALLPTCTKLAILDHRIIRQDEYIRVFTKTHSLEKDDPRRLDYILHLGLVLGNTPFLNRYYDPQHCLPNIVGKSNIFYETLTKLSLEGLKLNDSFKLPSLPSLTILNVSSNHFTNFESFNLSNLTNLLFFDLRKNKLRLTPYEIASSLSNLTKLYGFAMQGNPGYTIKFRMKLILAIPELSGLDCVLKIIDDPITVDERVHAWSTVPHLIDEHSATPMTPITPMTDGQTRKERVRRGSTGGYQRPLPDPANERLYKFTVKANKDNLAIHELALETLRLQRENAMTSEARVRVDGSTSSPTPAAAAPPGGANPAQVNKLLAISGHVRAGGGSSIGDRKSIFGGSPGKARLSISTASTPAAVAAAARDLEQLEKNIFKFHLVLQQQCPPNCETAQVKELSLTQMGLAWIDVAPFQAMTKLLISRNNLTTLAGAGLETLKNLIVLDAHHNRLFDLGEVLNICNELPQLEFVSFARNPFQLVDGNLSSEKAASLLQPDENGVLPINPSLLSPTHASSSTSAGGLLSSVQLYSADKYRLTFIGHCLQLQSPARRLKYLDHTFISEDEIIHGLKELGHSSVDREMFRFNSITFGMDGSNPTMTKINLSGKKLQRGDFTRFTYLTELDLSHNLYDDATLLQSHLPQLIRLTSLDVSHNLLKSLTQFARIVNAIPTLKILNCRSNPGYSRSGDSERARRHFLASFENIHMTSFKLQFLNQQKITIDERIEALHHAKNHWQTLYGGSVPQQSVDLIGARDIVIPVSLEPAELAVPASPAGGGGGSASPPAPTPRSVQPLSKVASPSGGNHGRVASLTPAQILKQGGVPLDLDGDIGTQAENARFILSVAELNLRPSSTEVSLARKNLRLLGGLTLGISSFINLTIVNLSDNHISDLRESGLSLLEKMHSLDLRNNEFASLENIIVSLRGCNALQWLRIRHATRDRDESNTPANYTPRVFGDLRGLRRCDEVDNANCILDDPLAASAQNLLWKIASVGPNNLKRVDLKNRHLASHLFYQILSPLRYLNIRELIASGNEFSLHPQYSDVIIVLLDNKKNFAWLDGVQIDDHRKMLAYRADKIGNENGRITGNLVIWDDHHKSIHHDVDEWLARQERHRVRQAEKEEAEAKKNDPEHALDYRVDLPNMQTVNVNVVHTSSGNATAAASILSKLEILIHYLQVYGMVLVMDIDIPYPSAFKDFSTWIRLSTLNVEDIFDINEDYKQDVLFAFIMGGPALFIGLYLYFDRLRGQQDEWADNYVTRWDYVKVRTFFLWLFMIVVSTSCSFFFIDDFETIDEFRKGNQPTPLSLTWAIVFFCILTSWYYIWFKVVRLFQKHWKLDTTEVKLEFKQKWMHLIHWAQIVFLFAITAMYLPVARVILMQFACDTQTNPEAYESLVYKNRQCFPDEVFPVQYVAFVFIIVYIIGIPLFLIKLIREGIAVVMQLNTIHENLGREITLLQQQIRYLRKSASETIQGEQETSHQYKMRINVFAEHIQQRKKLIQRKKFEQEAEYFQRINDPIRKLSSTSLYAAYEYRWRFWKLIQFMQNLTLVCIALFVPHDIGGVGEGRLLLGTLAIASSFLFVCYVRPYYNRLEDFMEILAGLANTITVLVALGLKYNVSWLTAGLSNVILLVANLGAVGAFLIAIIIVPCQIWRHSKHAKRQNAEAEARIKALNEDTRRRNQRRLEEQKRIEAEAKAKANTTPAPAPTPTKQQQPKIELAVRK